jgi:hypothetical protein
MYSSVLVTHVWLLNEFFESKVFKSFMNFRMLPSLELYTAEFREGIAYTKVSANDEINWKNPEVKACAPSDRFGNV